MHIQNLFTGILAIGALVIGGCDTVREVRHVSSRVYTVIYAGAFAVHRRSRALHARSGL